MVGAHAALYRMKSGKTQSRLADWARVLLAKKPFKLVAVALANKMARTAWAIMAKKTSYNPGFGPPLKQQHSARQTRELQGIQRLAVR